jgi:bifunctional non-homologous end joining protein LigD
MERRAERLADRKGRAAPVAGHFIEPMACLAMANLPAGPAWEYELKLDGYRAIAFKTRNRVHLVSRNGKDFAQRYPALVHALEPLPNETVADGEIVALDENGRPSFNLLQNYATHEYTLAFYLFDLLILAGIELRNETLETRRTRLRTRVMPRLAEPIRFSEKIQTSAAELIRAVREQGLEGVIAKRLDSTYQPGKRSGAWVKMRVNRGQELVIGGYVPAPNNFDSIVVGYYEGEQLIYVARIRNGFTPASRATLFKHFSGLERQSCPFQNLPESGKGRWGEGLTAEDMSKCRWLQPRLVAAIEFAEWTPANHLRHPKFIALRDDKDAKEVVREALGAEA